MLPTVGRIVYYWPSNEERLVLPNVPNEPFAAIVCGVQSSSVLNLSVFDSNGHQFPATNVPFVNEGEVFESGKTHAAWMPYQIAAAKEVTSTMAKIDVPIIANVPMV